MQDFFVRGLGRGLVSTAILGGAFALGGCTLDAARPQTSMPASSAAADMEAHIARAKIDRPDLEEGIRLLRGGRPEEANEIFEKGLKRNPSDGTMHFFNGLAYHLRGGEGNQALMDLAETGYQLALKFDPDNIWAAYLLGQIAYGAQRYVDSQNYYSYGILYQPDSPELLSGLLVSSYAARDLDVALWASKRLEEVAPDDARARRNALLAYAAAGQIDHARHNLTVLDGMGAVGEGRRRSLEGRVRDWEGYYARSGLQLAFSDALPFEERRKAREEEPPLPEAAPRGDVTKGDLDRSPQPSSSTANSRTRTNAQADAKADSKPEAKVEKGPKMALVDVAIIRTEENRTSSQGVNLLSGLQATLGGTLYSLNFTDGHQNHTKTETLQHTFNPVFTLAGLTYNLNIFNDGVERAEVLARPSLLAVENKTSEFFSGGVWHVQLSGNLTYGSIEEVPIGLSLKVTPQFLDDELLMISVNAERSFLEERSAQVGFTAFSETTKTSVQANAKLRFGETLILSGLSENESNRSRDGVPVLDQLPGIQYLFSHREEQKTHRSVLVLLTPRKPRFIEGGVTPATAKVEAAKPDQKSRFRDQLRNKEGIRPNIDAVLAGLEHSDFYRQFRTGDMSMSDWREHDGVDKIIESFFRLIYF